jgi:hypothetical protein
MTEFSSEIIIPSTFEQECNGMCPPSPRAPFETARVNRTPWLHRSRSENGQSKCGKSQRDPTCERICSEACELRGDRYGGTPNPQLDSPDKRSHSDLLPLSQWLRDHVLGSSEPANSFSDSKDAKTDLLNRS